MWSHPIGKSICSSPAVVNGMVYIGSSDNNTYCLNATTGQMIWIYNAGTDILSSPTVAYGMVYIGLADKSQIFCLNATTGSFIWNYTTFGPIISTCAVANGRVYVGAMVANLYCLNAFTGSKIWSCNTDNLTSSIGICYSSPAVANGMVYFGTLLNNDTICLNASSGTLLWKFTANGPIYSSPAIANGMVYIQSSDGYLYCLPMLLTVHNNSIGGMNIIELSSIIVVGMMISVVTTKKRLKF